MTEGGGPSATNVAVLEIQEFETAFPVSAAEKDEVLRRFSTLLMDSSGARRSGANGFVTRAYNVFGEEFAVKRLRAEAGTPTIGGEAPQVTDRSLTAFRTEFEGQLALANLKGFPRLYGFGKAADLPLIVMEWVDGMSLSELMDSAPNGSGLNTAFAIRVGAALFDALARLDNLSSRPVHRDLSSSNVMIRTSKRSLEEQIDSGNIDLCIIDFGSTTVLDKQDPRFTAVTSIMRHATPEYAPPEMLTDALPDILILRQSPTIDVYAACSIIYELLTGHTPFMLSERPEEIPYLVKTTTNPEPLRMEGHEQLAHLLMAGLSQDQDQRPTAAELRDAFMRAAGQSFPEGSRSMAREEPPTQGVVLQIPAGGRDTAGVKSASFGHSRDKQASLDNGRDSVMSRRNFMKLAIGGAAGLVVLGAGGLALFNSLSEHAEEGEAEDVLSSSAAYTGGSLYTAQDAETMLWGYVNAQRQWVITPRFETLPGLFSEGLALVQDEESGLYGYIGEDGAWKIEPAFTSANAFGEGYAFVQRTQDGNGSRQKASSYAGWIDMKGDWVIDPTFVGGGIFSNGLCTAMNETGTDARWGYIDKSGAWVIPPTFMNAGSFADNGLAPASLHTSRYGWIARDGSWAIEPAYVRVSAFSEGLAPCADTWSELWGYVDEKGTIVIDQRFASARLFKAGLASCKDKESDLWGFIDQHGVWKIEPQFERAGDFLHGLAAAQDAESHLFGYIDDTGQWVIPPQYASVNLSLME